MERGGTIYIITNFTHTTLYAGVTSDIMFRVKEHKDKEHLKFFSAKYNTDKLVYFCSYDSVAEAISEEKRIEGGSRKKKIKLIESMNPGWEDLSELVKEW